MSREKRPNKSVATRNKNLEDARRALLAPADGESRRGHQDNQSSRLGRVSADFTREMEYIESNNPEIGTRAPRGRKPGFGEAIEQSAREAELEWNAYHGYELLSPKELEEMNLQEELERARRGEFSNR